MGKSRSKYTLLLNSGKLLKKYPQLSGMYETDRIEWKKLKKKSKKNKEPKDEVSSNAYTPSSTLGEWEFLEKYLNGHSPSGSETEGQAIWRKYMNSFVKNYSESTNSHGNSVFTLRSNRENASIPKVLIEAHCDEVSYIITKISSEGLIYVVRNGGSDEAIAPSKKVLIHTEQGKVSAVFGWIAIHIRDRNIDPDRNNIFLDAGYNSKEEVLKAGIEVGQFVTYDDKCFIMGDKIVGKSLDNKLGGYVIAQVAKKFNLVKNRNFDLVVANCVQEEVGLLGAKMLMNDLVPDLAIVIDVTHDTNTPSMNNKLLGDIKCGAGPVVVRGAAIDTSIEKRLISNLDIPYQVQACSGRGTGTDTDEISYSNGGVSTTLVKFPLRYMHTTVETCSIKDVNSTIDLIFGMLMNYNNRLS